MSSVERLIGSTKKNLGNSARMLSTGVIVGGFAAGFSPSTENSTDSPDHISESHLVLEESLLNSEMRLDGWRLFDLSDLKPGVSTEDADKIVMTVFVSAYMVGIWTQVRKNLEIATRWEKRFGWAGVAVQSLAATYAIARVWDADFGDNQEDLDKAAITGFILGYIGAKGALTMRGMSNGLPWTKAIAETGLGVEAAAGAYGIARVTEIIK